ncbi:MAG: alpha/beta fold hydrolase [Firmicutes bacterium]|jgi:pimeloyl-ACP methyl ester carboxylesterase|nr:alpha/beta fold hydrolase [Bacillota bacterium]HPU00504.1 alpha/beta fold hydrolase [Bacillota bacterium]
MAQVKANGITLEYEEQGHRHHPSMLLIMGLGGQLIDWPEEFIRGLAERGFRVICFDNRDAGLSTKLEGVKKPNIARVFLLASMGLKPRVPYTLDDMALDTVGLMDALGIESTHVVGVSMGGMIAQILGAKHGERVKSLTLMITSSGNPRMPAPRPQVLQKFMRVPKSMDKEEWIKYNLELLTTIGSPGLDREKLALDVRKSIERCLCPEGTQRQLAAILQSGSRVKLLRRIAVPTLVISGAEDPLLPYQCGRDIADHIPGARFELIEGMGHDIPERHIPRLIELIAGHAAAAEA